MDKVGYPSWREKWVCIFIYLLKNERKCPNFEKIKIKIQKSNTMSKCKNQSV
jgi:hypothetical protein